MFAEKEIKERILKKSEEMFFKFGPSKVTMDEVASELGMSKKTLYKFFQSKEHLLREMIFEMKCEVASSIDELIENREMDFVEKLKKLMEIISNQSSKLKGPFISDLQKNVPDCWNDINEFRRKNAFEKFKMLLDEGIEKGAFRKDLDKELVVMIYVNSIQALINPETLSQIPYSGKQVYETLVRIIFGGILSEEGRTNYNAKLNEEGGNVS